MSLDPHRQQIAREYGRRRRILFVASSLYSAVLVAAAIAWVAAGLPISGQGLAFPLDVLAAFGTLFALYEAATFPVAVFSGWTLPRRYGLSTQSFSGWLADWAKSFAIGLVLAGAAVVMIYGLMRLTPSTWWLWAGLVAALFTAVLANLAPVLLLPLFYRLEPLDDPELVERLERLAARAGARVRGVYTMNFSSKSTGANAMLMGWGNTRRIVLTDTLLDRYQPEEIEVVLAHELGHHVHRDIPKLIVIQSLLTLGSFLVAHLVLVGFGPALGVPSIDSPLGLPLLAASLGAVGLLTMPLSNAISRLIERAADSYALRQTRLVDAFVGAMDKLTDQNLAESRPPKWAELILASHPTHFDRVAFARRFEHEAAR